MQKRAGSQEQADKSKQTEASGQEQSEKVSASPKGQNETLLSEFPAKIPKHPDEKSSAATTSPSVSSLIAERDFLLLKFSIFFINEFRETLLFR